MDAIDHREIIAKRLVESASQLIDEFAQGKADPKSPYELTEVLPDGNILGVFWYGHAGAGYFACNCNHRFKTDDGAHHTNAQMLVHFLECPGVADIRKSG